MFTIVNGYPLSGKSEYIFDKIKNSLSLGRQVILITPEQHLVSAEREIADRIEPLYTMQTEVLSFGRLANRVFREYGGLCYNYIKPGGDMLIMWKAIMSVSPFLSLYKTINPRDISTLSMFLSLEKTFARSGAELSSLEKSIEDEFGENARLSMKLHDIAMIFSAYRNCLAERYSDPEDDVNRLASDPHCREFFRGKDVYIDSFNSFTGSEYKVIKQIMKGALNLTVTVNSLREDERAFNDKTNECRSMLKKIAAKLDIKATSIDVDYKKDRFPEFVHLQKNIFSEDKEVYSSKPERIKIFAAKDPMDEIEHVFEDILDYVKNKGGRFSDCVICAADIESYSGIIKGLAGQLNIPCFTSKRYALSGRAAIRAVKLIPNLYRHSFAPDDVIEFLKTGFSGIEEDDALVLEEYIRTWNISGKQRYYNEFKLNPNGRVEGFSEEATELLERLNGIRARFIEPFILFEKALSHYETGYENEQNKRLTVGGYLRALTELLCRLDFQGVLETMREAARERGDLVIARQHEHTWEQICDCLDAIYQGVGELDCSHENFSLLFDGVVTANDTGIIPTSTDEVLTGNALMLRPQNAKRVYIIGVNDGVFPKNSSDSDGIFTDSELDILKGHSIDMGMNSEKKLYDELFSFYSVACVARERLFVSYHLTDMSGKSAIASEIINEIKEIFKDITVESSVGRSLSQLLYVNDYSEENFWNLVDNKISAEMIKANYGGMMKLSQSKIDRFVLCPFSYNCQYVLNLKEEKTHEIREDIFGTLIHAVLEKFLKEASKLPMGVGGLDREKAREIVDRIVDEYALATGLNDDDDVRSRHLIRRVKYTVLLLVCDLRDEFGKSKFTPKAFELPVGFEPNDDGISIPAAEINLDDGTKVVLRGYVDRLDSYKNGDSIYLRIVDYKTGDKSLKKEDVAKGLNIQMLLYMKCICSSNSPTLDRATDRLEGEKYVPAGVIYHISKRPYKTNGEEKSVKRSGMLLFDKDILAAMDPELKGRFIPYKDNGKKQESVMEKEAFEELLDGVIDTVKNVAEDINSGRADIAPMKDSSHDACKYCKMYPICRRDSVTDYSDDGEYDE